jgi:small neutral amino acid transporter SnatA (MarC family)
VLTIFGISLPVVRLGGGLLVAAAAWRLLHRTEDDDVHAAVLERLGEVGTLVMIRLMAFMLLCIGIQIMWTGWAELNGMTP